VSFRIQSVENRFNAKELRCKGANMKNELSHTIG
jgi:hypothetical protein